jgi:hypothetical protein
MTTTTTTTPSSSPIITTAMDEEKQLDQEGEVIAEDNHNNDDDNEEEDDGDEDDCDEEDDDDNVFEEDSDFDEPSNNKKKKEMSKTITTTPTTTTTKKRKSSSAGDDTGDKSNSTTPKKSSSAAKRTKTISSKSNTKTTRSTTSKDNTKMIKKIPDGEEEPTIFKYLENANRPYNSMALFENLHRSISKTKVQKVLDDLVLAGKIGETGETSKIYWINQDLIPMPTPQEEANMGTQMIELENSIKTSSANLVIFRNEVNNLAIEPGNSELDGLIQEVTTQNEETKNKLETYQNQIKSMSPSSSTTTPPTTSSSSSLSSNNTIPEIMDVKLLTSERDFYNKFIKTQKSIILNVLGDITSAMETDKSLGVIAAEIGMDIV